MPYNMKTTLPNHTAHAAPDIRRLVEAVRTYTLCTFLNRL